VLTIQEVSANQVIGYPFYLGTLALIGWSLDHYLASFLTLGALLIMTWELFRKKEHVFQNFSATLFSSLFVGLFVGYLIRLHSLETGVATVWNAGFGPWAVISIFLGVWICDMLAYLLGSAFGKHKIFPRVSPNKSWEGSISGLVGAILTMLLFMWFNLLPGLEIMDAVILGFITGGLGQVGDFAESLVKRDLAIKDSSNLLPGHGGAWDRMDSLLFAIPLGYLYIQYFVV
jgi:phosphatidate cytidylyltransferase